MEIVPVIDLKGGQAVHARRGERHIYQPVRSGLCDGSDPIDVARGFLALHPFSTFYIADLDAIQGQGDNLEVLERLRRAVPGVRLWMDTGLAEHAACRAWLARGLGDLVIGSETQQDHHLLERLRNEVQSDRVVLSLDFQADRFLGPDALLARPGLWPDDVIVITLARVGSGRGPDLDRLRSVREKAGERRVYAGGGVRGIADLRALQDLGLAGALVATALHESAIEANDIERLRTAARPNPIGSVVDG